MIKLLSRLLAVMIAAAAVFWSAVPETVFAAAQTEQAQDSATGKEMSGEDPGLPEEEISAGDPELSEEAGSEGSTETASGSASTTGKDAQESGGETSGDETAEEDPPDPETSGTGRSLDRSEEEIKEETTGAGKVALRFDSAGGTVRVILSSDQGACEDDPSYILEKKEDGNIEVTERGGKSYAAKVTEEGYVLEIEEKEDTLITVTALPLEGYRVSEFTVDSDTGEETETGFVSGAERFSYTASVIRETCKVFSVRFSQAEGENKDEKALSEMPELNAEKKAGRYTVKIHAAAGVLPKDTVVEVKELVGSEAEPFAEKAERLADVGEAVAVIDIKFTDGKGNEIKPAGMVDVEFENAAEEDAVMSIYHAKESDAGKMEAVPADTVGSSVHIKSSSFSPYVLLAASGEPNWTKDGGGRRDVSELIKIRHFGGYRYWYKQYGFLDSENDDWSTFSYGMYVNGELVGWSVCVDPLFDGRDMDNVWAGEVWQVSAPMFVKALYYGYGGPGSDVLAAITGTNDRAVNNIVTHVAASEIYARLGYSQSAVGDGFIDASGKLINLVYRFVKKIEDLPVPENYYGYVTAKNGRSGVGYRRQNFGFGSSTLIPCAHVVKVSSDPEISGGNKCYSLENARYWLYTSEEAALARGDAGFVPGGYLITNEEGISNTLELSPGIYYMIEGWAPEGFTRSDTVYEINASPGRTIEVTAEDAPVFIPADLRINKKCRGGGKVINTLEGTQFTVDYYTGYYDASTLPESPDRSWVIKVKKSGNTYISGLSDEFKVSGDEFFKNGEDTVLPLGTITIRETKAAPGYLNDCRFGKSDLYIGQVKSDSSGPVCKAELVDIQGTRAADGSIEAVDTPAPPELGTEAVDNASGTHTAFAGGEVTIKDTVAYKNLIAGNEYTLKGRLIDKDSGKAIRDAEGEEVTAQKVFTAETISGTVTMQFTFEADSSLAGKTTVVFETLQFEGRDLVSHEDPGDEKQTIRFPRIGTSAVNPETNDRTMRKQTDAQIIDKVSYENLDPGREYTLKGSLMVKSTGNVFTANGEEVRAEKTFIPEKAEGQTDITFSFDASDLDEGGLVVFEELYSDTDLVAEHKDLEDTGQTICKPNILTDAYDEETGTKNTKAGTERILVDKVSYSGLLSGKTYVISGEVKIKSSEEGTFEAAQTIPSQIVGAEGEGEVSFDSSKVTLIPAGEEGQTVSGVLLVSFKVDTSEFTGKDLVIGETLEHNGVELAVHHDLHDKDQTIYVPEIHTSACDAADGDREISYKGEVQIRDTVTYRNLIPGMQYRVKGVLMNKSSKVPAKSGGREITAETVFTPEKEEGTAEVTFRFDSSDLPDGEFVVFETVWAINTDTGEEKEIAEHKDYEDRAQTVSRSTPPGTKTGAATGDESGTKGWILAFGASAAALAGIFLVRKRKAAKNR